MNSTHTQQRSLRLVTGPGSWGRFALVSVAMLLAGPASAQVLQNADFSDGLTGWTAGQSGGPSAPGQVTVETVGGSTLAALHEGDSALVTLSQRFDKPAGLLSLTVTVRPDPGLDVSADAGIRDTFELGLLNDDGYSLIPTWAPHAATAYNLPEGEAPRVGSGTGLSQEAGAHVVTFDVSTIAAGTPITLRATLVGGDADQGSTVLVGEISWVFANKGPLAAIVPVGPVACGDAITLDGTTSSDPEADPLTFQWTDSTGTEVGTQPTLGLTLPVGTHIYTLTVADPEGLESSAEVTVTVTDVTAPVIDGFDTSPLTIEPSASCAGTVPDLTVITTSDACTPPVVSQSPPIGTALVVGEPVTVVVTSADAQGNQTTVSRTVTLVDDDAPTLSGTLDDTTLPVGASCTLALADLAAELDGSDTCGEVTLVQDPPAGTLLGAPGGIASSTTVTVTATDPSGNQATTSAAITASDQTPPALTAPLQPILLSGGLQCKSVVPDVTALPAVSDNCSGVTVTQDPPKGTSVGLDPVIVTVTFTDAAGNQSTGTITVSVSDDAAPSIGGLPSTLTVVADDNCGGQLPDLRSQATVLDTCVGTPTLTQSPPPGTAMTFGEPMVVTVTATDAAGNTSDLTVTVSLKDEYQPFLGPIGDVGVAAGEGCAGTIPNVTSGVAANDTCGPVTLTQDPPVGTPLEVGAPQEVTVTATDGSGNQKSRTLTVGLVDAISPTIELATVDPVEADAACSGVVPDISDAVTSADACGVETTEQSPPAGTALELGVEQVVTVTVTDAAGNEATATTPVSLVDVTPPAAPALPAEMTVPGNELCAGVLPDLTAGLSGTDACGPVSFVQLPAAGTALAFGVPTAVQVFAYDVANNSAWTDVSVSLVDTQAPTAAVLAAPEPVVVDTSCQAVVPDLTALASGDDACGATAVTQAPPAGTPVTPGTSTVTFTVSDGAGNTATADTTLTVSDTLAPVITLAVGAAAGNVEIIALDGCEGLVPDLGATALDNCDGAVTVTQDPPAGTPLLAGDLGTPVTVTLTASDAGGTEGSKTVAVVLIDPNNECGDTPGPGAETDNPEQPDGAEVVENEDQPGTPDPGPDMAEPVETAEPDADAGVVVEGSGADAGSAGADAGVAAGPELDAGCGCRTPGRPGRIPSGAPLVLVGLMLAYALLKRSARPRADARCKKKVREPPKN